MFDYESPIKMVVSEMQTTCENDVLKVVQNYGFDIDKNELAKALAYDRKQYEIGYHQGKTEGARGFADLLKKKFNEYIDYDDNGEQTFESNPDLVWNAIDEALAEMKGE